MSGYRFEPTAWKRVEWEPRTLADEPRTTPVDQTRHEHIHSHGGVTHAHSHVHPSDHAHSRRTDTPAHEEVA